MRIFKGFIGWICFLSLVAAPVSVFLWLWAFAWPFLHGATLTRLSDPNLQALSTSVSKIGISSSANPILADFVKQPAVPSSTRTGFDAVLDAITGSPFQLLDVRNIPFARGMHSAYAATVADMNNKIVAAYPTSLIGMDYNIASAPYIRQSRPQSGYSQDALIYNTKGALVGRLRVYANGNLMLQNVNQTQRTPSWLLDISGYGTSMNITSLYIRLIVLLILFIILLPIWVGMDASWRGMRPFVWGILVFLTSFIGLLAYLIARLPAPRSCLNCGEKVFGKYLRCPACGVDFLQRCPNCGSKMKPGWQFCPLCRMPGDEPDNKSFQIDDAPTVLAAPRKASNIGILDVIITDADTGLPLRSASVSAHGPSELSGLTNGRGVFTMHRLSDGEYSISVSKNGYSTEKRSILISNSQNEKLCISVNPLPGKVIGRVEDCSTGKAVSGAKVYLDTARIDKTANTGDDGTYILDDLPQGDYSLVIEAVRYKSLTRLVEVCPGQSIVADMKLMLIETGLTVSVEEVKTDVIS
jgi:hypothetical protein